MTLSMARTSNLSNRSNRPSHMTDIKQDNSSNIAWIVYKYGEAIDGTTGITRRHKRCCTGWLAKGSSTGAWCIQVSAEISSLLVIRCTTATATWSDISQEDGLTELEISVTGKLIKGDPCLRG